ncbi:MAG: hypothetical protein OEM67_08515 [Thermoleophilia bacterium]|nr:hypothetical protein [Thermoleophilia bacterium]
MCEPPARCHTETGPKESVELRVCQDIGVWRLRTPFSDLIGRIDGDACLGLEDAFQQAIGNAERNEHDLIARQLRELVTGLEAGQPSQ